MQQKRHIQILKASLPYMHSPLREACRICVRMFELQQAMHRLEEEKISWRPAVRMTGSAHRLISVIREYCTPKELETLDMVTNLAQMARLYREYESEGGAKHDDNTI